MKSWSSVSTRVFWNDPCPAQYTHYSKTLSDAILNKTLAPSTGFGGSQIVNVGLVRTWGHELGDDQRAECPGSVGSWTLSSQPTKARIDDMGGVISDINREGYPIASYFSRRVLSAEIDANRNVLNAM